MGPAEQVRAALVARRFFLDGKAKTEIADEFGISRFKVAQILDDAREQGIVRIEINLPAELDADLSAELRRVFGLHHALVVATPEGDDTTLREQLGRAAAGLLTEITSEEDVLGVGWGRTLDAMADALESLEPCHVVQMTGVVGTVSQNSVELVRRIAAVAGGRAYPIYAPLFYENASTLNGISRQATIASALRQFPSITIAIVAIGSWEPPESRVYEALAPPERDPLKSIGARAEICASLINDEGEWIPTPLSDRTLAIRLDQLRHATEIIGVAGGRRKTAAIRAVLAGHHVTSLVTDVAVAMELLGHS
jgi:DNA-binding transcriptional regulator LsrR (DeoR family)